MWRVSAVHEYTVDVSRSFFTLGTAGGTGERETTLKRGMEIESAIRSTFRIFNCSFNSLALLAECYEPLLHPSYPFPAKPQTKCLRPHPP